MNTTDALNEQLESLEALSAGIAAVQSLPEIYERALVRCLEFTGSEMAFVALLDHDNTHLDVAAIKGFEPSDPEFYDRYRRIPIRPSAFGVVITEGRSTISNDVARDPNRMGTPPGHPTVRSFMGVPLRVGEATIGMIGVANAPGGYQPADERLLSTFANQVAIAIQQHRLYEQQRELVAGLQQLHQRLNDTDREQLLGRERERIAVGLHDDIEQRLFSIGLRLSTLLEDELDPEVAGSLREVRQMTRGVTDRLHDVVFALSAFGHDYGDLASTVRGLLRTVEDDTAIQTDMVVCGSEPDEMGKARDVLFEVIKEALTNVRKHAQARMVLVSIRYTGERVDVVVQDDGDGAPEMVLRSFPDSYLHFGLRHMRQQVLELGGTLEVTNGEERGLTVRVSVPNPEAPA
jgi:signal transduction histidine kinase